MGDTLRNAVFLLPVRSKMNSQWTCARCKPGAATASGATRQRQRCVCVCMTPVCAPLLNSTLSSVAIASQVQRQAAPKAVETRCAGTRTRAQRSMCLSLRVRDAPLKRGICLLRETKRLRPSTLILLKRQPGAPRADAFHFPRQARTRHAPQRRGDARGAKGDRQA